MRRRPNSNTTKLNIYRRNTWRAVVVAWPCRVDRSGGLRDRQLLYNHSLSGSIPASCRGTIRAAALPQATKARVDLAFLIGDSVIVDGRMGTVRGIRIGTSPMAVIYEVASPCGRPLGWFPDFQLIDAE